MLLHLRLRARIEHADIKDENVMVGKADGVLRLVDFGMASRLRSDAPAGPYESVEKKGAFGTVGFLQPLVAWHQPDVFGTAIVILLFFLDGSAQAALDEFLLTFQYIVGLIESSPFTGNSVEWCYKDHWQDAGASFLERVLEKEDARYIKSLCECG